MPNFSEVSAARTSKIRRNPWQPCRWPAGESLKDGAGNQLLGDFGLFGLFRSAKGVSPHIGGRYLLWQMVAIHGLLLFVTEMIKTKSRGQQAPLTLSQPFRPLNFLEPRNASRTLSNVFSNPSHL